MLEMFVSIHVQYFADILRTVYTTIVPVVPIARLQSAVFSKVCHVVSSAVLLQFMIHIHCV